MTMQEIVEIYHVGKEKLTSQYGTLLGEREKCLKDVRDNVEGAQEKLSKLDDRCQQFLIMLGAVTSVGDVWHSMPIVFDDNVVEDGTLCVPIGQDAPDRTVMLSMILKDDENSPCLVSGHDLTGRRTFFMTFCTNMYNAKALAQAWIGHGKMPGGG